MFCHECGTALAAQTPFCPACGTRIRQPVAIQPRVGAEEKATGVGSKRKRAHLERAIVAAAVLLLLILVVSYENDRSAPTSAVGSAEAPASAPSEEVIPPSQKSFTSMIDSFTNKYNGAESAVSTADNSAATSAPIAGSFRRDELINRRDNVRAERRTALAEYFSRRDLRFQGWVGIVKEVRPVKDADGESASLSVKLLGTGIVLETAKGGKEADPWRRGLLVKLDEEGVSTPSERAELREGLTPSVNTKVSRNDALYQSLVNLRDGDKVTRDW